MKILITGGAGFIGSNLVERLIRDKNNYIIALDNLSTGKMSNIDKFLSCDNFKFINMDITSSEIINYLVDEKIDIIYNFACPASPKYYMIHPIETWKSSVIGVSNLLEVARILNIPMFHSSTSEVYGDAKVYPQDESYYGNVNPIGLRACYDEGKRASEAIIYDYMRVYDLDIKVGRIFNTYGPNMNSEDGRIVSNFVVEALNNEDMIIYGDGMQTRSFCYIDDTINAILKLMEMKKIDYPINLGNPEEHTVLEVANIIKSYLNSDSRIVFSESLSDDPRKRKPDITRAKKILNWEPEVPFKEGLSRTINYYKK